MGTFGEYVKSAMSSIRSNKGRSFLTMLGIIIGITAVLTVLIIGDGMKATVNSEMDSIGATTVTVSLDTTKTDKAFSKAELDEIEANIKNIYGISPDFNTYGEVQVRDTSYDMMISCGTAASVNKGKVTMLHGRYISKADVDEDKKVCVLSQIAADKIFGYDNVVGKTFSLTVGDLSTEFTVIGVRENNTMDTAYASYLDDPTLMGDFPYTSVFAAYNYDADGAFTSFLVYLDNENKNEVLSQTRAVVENVMGIRGENAVKISTSYGFDQTTESILNIITSVVAIIAAISLLVGGIGVMNIMTVSVTERTREIGIRKSLGARTSSILTQFLAEAAILTFIGGIIGLILGLSVAKLICTVVDFEFVVNPVLVIGVIAISVSIGLFFGIYPAKRAAQLDPIEALRME